MSEPVKGKTEAGRRREARARQTRERVVDAALRLFADRGYAATTVEAIATAAGVGTATVYQAFGTKQAILARGLDVTIAGDSSADAILDRDWVQRARDEPDARRRLAIVVAHTAEIAARTAPLKRVMRDAAATEPLVRDLIAADDERRYATHRALVELVTEAHPLRPGLDRDSAAATYFALVNSQLYEQLAGQLGWSVDDWRRWLAGVLERELLGPDPGPTRRRARRGS